MTSRLTQMQARFQQKQMQEKEEKLLKLYENQQQRAFERVGRNSAGSNATNGFGTPAGKVRQMFDERRQKAGIDKSYPLEPLKSKTAARVPNNNLSKTLVKTTVRKSVSQTRNGQPVVNQKETIQKTYANNSSCRKNGVFDSDDNLIDMMNNHNLGGNLDDEQMPRIGFNDDLEKPSYMTGKLSNLGGKLPSQMIENKTKTNGLSQRNDNIKEQEVTTKKPAVAKTTPSKANSTSSLSSSRDSPTRSETNMSTKSPPSASQRAPTNNRPSSKQTPKSPVVRDDLAECRFCGRRFATDRLGTHEEICAKSGKKKRKAYDATKHRVLGTELETYVIKGGKKGASAKAAAKHSTSASKTNWRRTHEEFIAAIRAAKEAQAHLAKGGKLSDLPPPPPSSNPDYVQCPHCGRRFNEAAAQRHIPKCASYDFNKPKPGAQSKARPGKR